MQRFMQGIKQILCAVNSLSIFSASFSESSLDFKSILSYFFPAAKFFSVGNFQIFFEMFLCSK